MNYEDIYHRLITRARFENREKGTGVYYERHHIIPKCIGGTDDNCNLVLLTAREHYIAHRLLVKMYDNPKLVFALNMMLVRNSSQDRCNARSYGYHRVMMAKALSEREVSDDTRRKLSESQKGLPRWTDDDKNEMSRRRKGHNYNTPEVRRKIGDAHRGKVTSDETKRKISIAKTGTTITEEHKRRVREFNLGSTRTQETKNRMSSSMRGKNTSYTYLVDGVVYISTGEIAELYGINRSTIKKRCLNVNFLNWIIL